MFVSVRAEVVLGILWGGGGGGSMGAVGLSAWTSWRIFLRTFPPSAPFFPLPGWFSLNILLSLPSANPHKLGLPWRAWLFHSPPDPLPPPPFWWSVSHNLRPCGPRIWPIFSYPALASFSLLGPLGIHAPGLGEFYQCITDEVCFCKIAVFVRAG